MPPKKKTVLAPASASNSTTRSKRKTATMAPSSTVTNGNNRKPKRKAEEPTQHTKSRKLKHEADAMPQPAKVASVAKPKVSKPRAAKSKVVLNNPPTKLLSVYTFGTNEQGELGLGAGASPNVVSRPRLNPKLSAGVVQIATGGMHCAALTSDNKILTWGVNDLGALGRDTEWKGNWVNLDAKDGKAGEDGDESESELNPREATPIEIEASIFPAGTVFVQVAAGDSATFALTDEGMVYGWGTFKASNGKLGFSPGTAIQKRPILIPMSQKIIKIVAGNNHALALTVNGAVLTWGIGEQHQLGRRVSDRRKCNGLMPQSTALLKDFINIGAGADHSFAVHKTGELYGWGLNNFGQTGVHGSGGEEFDSILYPATVNSVGKHGKVVHVDGGNHHSIAVTDQGACLTWGRIDTYVCGLKIDSVPEENIVRNEHDKPKILKVATPVPGLDVASAAAGSEHCIAITQNGKAYSWGFNAMGQTGQGPAGEDIECATLIDNTAVRDKTLMWAGAGGQYSVLAGNGTTTINGVQYTSLDIV